MSYIVIDVETTGLTASDEVIQLSAIKLDTKNVDIEDVCSFYCKPSVKISEEASNVHGITQGEIARLSNNKNIVEQIENSFLVNERNSTFIFYNAKFDVSKILTSCAKYGKPNILPFDHEIYSLARVPDRASYMCLMKYYARHNKGKWRKLEEVYDEFCSVPKNVIGTIAQHIMDNFPNQSIAYNHKNAAHDSLFDTIMTVYLLREVILKNR